MLLSTELRKGARGFCPTVFCPTTGTSHMLFFPSVMKPKFATKLNGHSGQISPRVETTRMTVMMDDLFNEL
jgi:hypothetical protein